jgi:hypothetical protein
VSYDQILTAGDRAPALAVQLVNADGSAPDLTGATVEARVMRADRTQQAFVSAATVVNAKGGYVSHAWAAAETALAGVLLVQFRRTDVGFSQTWPCDRYLTVRVNPALTPPSAP